MAVLDMIAKILLIIGGLNWGLFGLLDFNLVAEIGGTGIIATIIYVLVGLSAIWMIFKFNAK